jgi:hypothetical protein
MLTRVNRSAQPTPAKPAPRIMPPPVEQTGEQSQVVSNTFVDSLLEFKGSSAGNDPYNHTGRRSGR